jgi:hypothetical protein
VQGVEVTSMGQSAKAFVILEGYLLTCNASGYSSLDNARVESVLFHVSEGDVLTHSGFKSVPCTILAVTRNEDGIDVCYFM